MRSRESVSWKVGDRVLWYDPLLWGPRDIGNNEHCYKPGTIVAVYDDPRDGWMVDIQFDHRAFVSRGHFAGHLHGGKLLVG